MESLLYETGNYLTINNEGNISEQVFFLSQWIFNWMAKINVGNVQFLRPMYMLNL